MNHCTFWEFPLQVSSPSGTRGQAMSLPFDTQSANGSVSRVHELFHYVTSTTLSESWSQSEWPSKVNEVKSCTKTIFVAAAQVHLHPPDPAPGSVPLRYPAASSMDTPTGPHRASPRCSPARGFQPSVEVTSGSTGRYLQPKPAPPSGQDPGHKRDILCLLCTILYILLPYAQVDLARLQWIFRIYHSDMSRQTNHNWDSCPLHTFLLLPVLSESLLLHFRVQNPKLDFQ